jgi:hypothetical protein
MRDRGRFAPFNEPEIGLVCLRAGGEIENVLLTRAVLRQSCAV